MCFSRPACLHSFVRQGYVQIGGPRTAGHGLGPAGVDAPQDRLHPGGEFVGGKRFGDVVIRAHFQPADFVIVAALGGDHDYGDAQ